MPAGPRRSVELRDGRDFDAVVFGLSVGMVPLVAGDLMARHPRWRDMAEALGTVSTQSFQVWLREDQRALGWRGPERVTVSGYVEPFDTWASMGHLIDREDWPVAGRPGAIAYFCNALAGAAGDGSEGGGGAGATRSRTGPSRSSGATCPCSSPARGIRAPVTSAGTSSATGSAAASEERGRTPGVRLPVLAGQHRSVRPLRPVAAGHGSLPARPR